MFWEKLDAVSERLRRAAPESRLLAAGIGFARPDRVPAVGSYRRAMRLAESSRALSFLRVLRGRLLSRSLREVGLFLVSWSAVSAFFGWLRSGRTTDAGFLFPLLSGMILLPLLAERRTVRSLFREECLIGKFFFGFCRLSDDALYGAEPASGTAVFPALFGGAALGTLSAFVPPFWFPATVLTASICAIGFAVPELPLLAILLAFPFYGLTAHPSLLLALSAAFLLVCCLGKVVRGQRPVAVRPVDFAALLFAAVCVGGGAVSATGIAPSGFLSAFLIVASWLPARVLLSSRLWLRRAVDALLLSGSVCAGIGVIQYASGKTTAGWMDLSRFGSLGGRVCSTFSNPNLLAIFLLAVYALALGSVLTGRRLTLIPLLLSGGCLIVTWSRGAWLGALAATVFLLAVSCRRSLSCLLISPLALFAALPWIPETVRLRFSSIGVSGDSSARYRVSTYRGVLRLLKRYPCGIGNGESAFHRMFAGFAVSGTESVMHAHNVFLQVAVEHGIPGLLIFLTVPLLLFCDFLRVGLSDPAGCSRSGASGAVAAIVGLLVMGCFDHLWYQPTLLWLFWFLSALSVTYAQTSGKIQKEVSP